MLSLVDVPTISNDSLCILAENSDFHRYPKKKEKVTNAEYVWDFYNIGLLV